MAHSKMINDLIDNNITITQALQKLFIIGTDIHNDDIWTWTNDELSGYKNKELVPEYRKHKAFSFTYSGSFSNISLKDVSFDVSCLSDEIIRSVSTVYIEESMDVIERKYYNRNAENFSINVSFLSNYIHHKNQVQYSEIKQHIEYNIYADTMHSVKLKLIKMLLLIELAYGDLDSLTDIEGRYDDDLINGVNDTIHNIIYGKETKVD